MLIVAALILAFTLFGIALGSSVIKNWHSLTESQDTEEVSVSVEDSDLEDPEEPEDSGSALSFTLGDDQTTTPPDDLITLAYAPESYDLADLQLGLTDYEFYLSFPEKLRSKVNFENYKEDHFFTPDTTLENLAEQTNIPNLAELVEKYRSLVAWDFIHRSDGCRFNHAIYGVYQVSTELPGPENGLLLKVYKTDSFTDRVMKAIYQEVKETGHPVNRVTTNSLTTYNIFATSVDLDLVAICQPYKTKRAALLQPSAAHSDRGHKPRITITAKARLLKNDVDFQKGVVDPVKWFTRTLREQLGLKKENLTEGEIKFYLHDFYLDRSDFTLGFTGSFVTKYNFKELKLFSGDKVLGNLVEVNLDEDDIRYFLEEHRLSLRDQFVFDLICRRHASYARGFKY